MKISFIKRTFSVLAVFALVFAQVSTVYAVSDTEILDAADDGVSYLEAQQQADGSITGDFGSETEWTVIAVVANGDDPRDIQATEGVSLIDAMADDTVDATTPALDVERKILALTAAGEDTTDFAGVDYNQLLADSSNAGQFGELNQLNDDAFGIIAVRATGDVALEDEAQAALDYLISHQEADGGFSWATPDNPYYWGADGASTASVIIALDAAAQIGLDNPDLESAQDGAVTYLLALQQPDGGFVYDVYSTEPDTGTTSWAVMALNLFKDVYADQIDAAKQWLLGKQNLDGGFQYGAYGLDESSSYYTSQSILALLGTTWLGEPEPIAHQDSTDPIDLGPEEEPIVAEPIETPVIEQVAGAVTKIVSTYRPRAVAATPTETETNDSDTSSTTTEEPSGTAPVVEEKDSSTGKIVGYVLIGLALAGLLGYVFRARSNGTPQ